MPDEPGKTSFLPPDALPRVGETVTIAGKRAVVLDTIGSLVRLRLEDGRELTTHVGNLEIPPNP